MEPLLPEADEAAQGEGVGVVTGPPVASRSHAFSPFLVSCSGQDASQALHVILQGKDPKIEEFVPPGQYRNVPRSLWAFPGVDGGCFLGSSGTPERRWWSGRAHPFLQMRTVL